MAPETQRPGDAARRLLRAVDRGALATSLAGGAEAAAGGWPYASLVLLACDHDAAPLLLISDLAEHSKNIADDPRVGLLIDGTVGRTDPLTGPRVTILGTAEKTDDARFKARFVARHPAAAQLLPAHPLRHAGLQRLRPDQAKRPPVPVVGRFRRRYPAVEAPLILKPAS